jgi:hypothetical protein
MQYPLYDMDHILNGILIFFYAIEFIIAISIMGSFLSDKTARFTIEYGQSTDEETDPLRNNYDDDVDGEIDDQDPSLIQRIRGSPSNKDKKSPNQARYPNSNRERDEANRLLFDDQNSNNSSVENTPRTSPHSSPNRPKRNPSSIQLTSLSSHPTSAVAQSSDGVYIDNSILTNFLPMRISQQEGFDRANETAQERTARRARDRAIIAGILPPMRPPNRLPPLERRISESTRTDTQKED